MKFNITLGLLINEIRTYIGLGLDVIAMVFNLPSMIIATLSKWIKPK